MADFQIVPDSDQLAKMERNLRFFPSQAKNARILSRDQVEAYNEQGYVKGISIFSEPEIRQIREFFDAILAQALAEGKDSYSISSAHLKYGPVYDLLSDSRIVSRVCDLLGHDVIGWGSHFFCKMPNDGKRVAWHQDSSYWPLSTSKTVTVWLAIDDADLGNACMQFLAGSHLDGQIAFRESSPDENNVLDQTVEDVEKFGDPIAVELAAGQISMHSDLLLHGSQANNSDRRRCGLTLRYCAADLRAGLDWHLKGVVVNGQDPSGHWANPRRPE